MKGISLAASVGLVCLACAGRATAQTGGTITGTVTMETTGDPLHGARIVVAPLGRHVDSDDNGKYEFRNIPPGSYSISASAPGLTSASQRVQVAAGSSQSIDLSVRLAAMHESITVTASGREESALTAVQTVSSLTQTDLQLRGAASLGDVLENEPGVSKRSFGPGNGRPVVRGFDGDRVLIMEDGISTGTLSYQSGDHGEPMDVNKLERVEVVRGPATLLYGSSAIGGVVNAVSRHEGFREHTHEGVSGYLTGIGGTNNALGGGSGGFEFGTKKWEFWASGGGQRTGSYQTPIGEIQNTQTRMEQTDAGLGRYGEKAFLAFNYSFTDSKYGIAANPAEVDPELSEIAMRKHTYRLNGGWKDIGGLDDIQFRMNYSDYHHQELVAETPETRFFNKQFVYRTVFDQKKKGRWGGSFGFAGLHRDFETTGAEVLAPPTIQNMFSLFALESIDFDTTRVQFGGRFEHNGYDPTGMRSRSFDGFSGAVGVSQRVGQNGAFVVNYSHSYRAPSLEELYNNGPHPGNVTFEIGNPDLRSEKNDGLDVSLRQGAGRVRGELNFFYYRISNFIFLAPTGAIEDGLIEADYLQNDSRYMGGEARLDVALHPNLWLKLGADTVNAKLTGADTFLPRIPPVRGRIGIEARYKGLSFRPELLLANAQNKLFPTETRTAGYATVNLSASYTLARTHTLHVFSAEVFNAGDQLYRNHLSFIKAFAPEIGRGVRFGYTVQLF
jgi:iron complex outermembrane receptor protein